MNKTSRISLHDIIQNDIRNRILTNEWQPGYRIPYEHELMKQYDCSRMTVSKAIAGLVDVGLLERRKRAGTFVVYPSIHRASIIIPDIRKAVLEAGHAYSYSALKVTTRPIASDEKEIFNIAEDQDLIEILSVHFADREPYAYESRRINLSVAPQAKSVDFHAMPPSIWLLTHVPWNNAKHEIEAVVLPEEIAGALAIKSGAPALHLERRTWNNDGVITHAHQYFPAGKLKLIASFLVNNIW